MKNWCEDEIFIGGGPRETVGVVEVDNEPEWTGLFDAYGVPLFRVKETIPFGFRGK